MKYPRHCCWEQKQICIIHGPSYETSHVIEKLLCQCLSYTLWPRPCNGKGGLLGYRSSSLEALHGSQPVAVFVFSFLILDVSEIDDLPSVAGNPSLSHRLWGCCAEKELQALVCLVLPSGSSVTLGKSFLSLNRISSKNERAGLGFLKSFLY